MTSEAASKESVTPVTSAADKSGFVEKLFTILAAMLVIASTAFSGTSSLF